MDRTTMRRAPNSAASFEARREELARAWTVDNRARGDFVVDACRGQRVLDVGCVNHSELALADPGWLHRRILDVASSCVGVDYEEPGIMQMASEGMEAYVVDVTQPPPAELTTVPPFDVVVAGELIEHLGHPQALLEFAKPLLAPGGRLLLTTPNPYALWRQRAGHLRLTWENTDHVVYLFPSGIAELASRSGYRVTLVTTVDHRDRRLIFRSSFRSGLVALVRRLLGTRRWEPVGSLGLSLPTTYLNPLEWLLSVMRRGGGQLGETSIYMLELATQARIGS